MKKIVKKNLIVASLFMIPFSAFAKEGKCEYVFASNPQTVLDQLIGKPEAIRGRLYPHGITPMADKHIMFGFESEYTLSTATALLKIYMPRPEFGISREQWLAKSDQDRVAWVKNQFSSVEHFSKDAGLVLIDGIPGLEFMPKELIKDDSGSLEIVLDPVNEISVFAHQVKTINKTFGLGSMQAMISTPKESFFSGSKKETIDGNMGFFTLMAEADVLQKLRSGADRYLADSSKEVARSFMHPFLAPMNKHRQNFLWKFMYDNSQGKGFDKETLKTVVYSEDSFKYSGTSAYRPDIGGSKRVSIEVRDAHVNEALLLEKTQRIVAMYMRGTERFADLAPLKNFDSKSVFESMPMNVQTMLRTVFPAKIQVDENYNAKEVFTQEFFRNFSYPMRDWSPFLKVMGKEKYISEVQQEQKVYLEKLKEVVSLLGKGSITKDEASRRVQGAAAVFSKESALNEHFENYLYSIL